jgi:hypothetical protein
MIAPWPTVHAFVVIQYRRRPAGSCQAIETNTKGRARRILRCVVSVVGFADVRIERSCEPT